MFPTLKSTSIFSALLCLSITIVNAAPRPTPIALFDPEVIELKARHDCQNETSNATPDPVDFRKQNGLDAQKLNGMFKTMKATDACQDGQMACIDSRFAQCTSSKWDLTSCASGTFCFALPLVNKPGTSLVCDVPSDANARFETAGVQGGPDGESDSNGDEDCDDSDPASTASDGSPNDDGDGDCDDDDPSISSASEAQPSPTGDSVVLTTVTTTITLPATPTASNIGRRQFITTISSPLPSQTQPSPSALTPTPFLPSPSSVPSSSVVSVATPTIVGESGIVTVTIVSVSVSTVTLTVSDCGPSTSPVSGFISNSGAPSGPTPSTFTDSSSPTSSTSPTIISLQAADPTTTPTQFGGISFSTQAVTPTPAPAPNSSPTQDANISQLLTATIGG